MSVSMIRFTEDLIDLVRAYPALYDTTAAGHKNEEYKVKAWNAIAFQLGEDVDKCRTRWRSLRTRYRKEMVKLERIKSGRSNEEKPTWQYNKKLSFLFDHLRARGTFHAKFRQTGRASLALAKINKMKSATAKRWNIPALCYIQRWARIFSSSVDQSSSDDNEEGTSPISLDAVKRKRIKGPEEELYESLKFGETSYPIISSVRENNDPFIPSECKVVPIDDQNNHIKYLEAKNTFDFEPIKSTPIPKTAKNQQGQPAFHESSPDENELFGRLVAAKLRKIQSVTQCQIAVLNVLNEFESNEND